MKATKYLLLSGPPGAGKDTIGGILSQYDGIVLAKFAAPLLAAATAFGFDMTEKAKEAKTGPGGLSRRQFQVELSERFAKPLMGNDIFGRALALRTKAHGGVVVVTDSGFLSEAEALAKEAGVENVRRLHLTREGHDFSGDSRSDWSVDGTGILRMDMDNSGPEDELHVKLINQLQPWRSWMVT